MSFKYELVSAYNDMLDIKVSLGFSRHNYTSHILRFIDFCTNKYPDASEITKEVKITQKANATEANMKIPYF